MIFQEFNILFRALLVDRDFSSLAPILYLNVVFYLDIHTRELVNLSPFILHTKTTHKSYDFLGKD